MLFSSRAFSSSRSLFRGATKRFKSTSAGPHESASSGGGESAFALVAVGTTFVTYMMADFLSNFIQHPTQKVCVVDFCFDVNIDVLVM